MTARPLAGIRVLDLSGLLPGPFASLMLADMGADVIKVETRLGDLARQVPPRMGERSALFLWLNRNKRSLGLNVKHARGRALFLALAARSDVVIESFRPGRVARMGIGPADTHAANPGLVYCSLSGYGQTGPDAQRAGHDATYLARTGLLDLSGPPGGPPVLPPVPIADLAAGTNAALAICAALVGRARTGAGATIDISLAESALAWAGPVVASHLAGLRAERGRMPLTGRYPYYQIYRAADGGYVALGVVEPVFWRALCDAIDRPDLAGQQFAEGAARERMADTLAAAFAARPSAAWADLFRERDLPAEVVADLDTALADPQLRDRRAFVVVTHPEDGPQLQVASPLHFAPTAPSGAGPEPADPTGARPPEPRPAPDLGADTRAVLAGVLGLGDDAIDALVADQVVFSVPESDRYRLAPDTIG